jgi:hypothetical protein
MGLPENFNLKHTSPFRRPQEHRITHTSLSLSFVMPKMLRISDAKRNKEVVISEDVAKKVEVWKGMMEIGKDSGEVVLPSRFLLRVDAKVILDDSSEDLNLLVNWLSGHARISNGIARKNSDTESV